MTGGRIDDERLMAYLDGELDPIDAGRVEQALATDADLARRLEAQRALRARLTAHYGPIAGEPVPERFRDMLERGVIPFAAPRAGRAPVWSFVAALAATLVLGLFIGRTLPSSAPFAIEGGAMVARGALAEALDTQLASAQPADAATRIGVTFASIDGRFCRTFERIELSGLACRTGEDWRLLMTGPGRQTPSGEYRQAGSGAILATAQEMMAGEPLDATAERRGRENGWRPAVSGSR